MKQISRSLGYFKRVFSPLAGTVGDPGEVLRARVLVLYIAFTMLLDLSWFQAHFRYGFSPFSAVLLLYALSALVLLLKLSHGGQLRPISHLVMLIGTLSIVTATYNTGGLRLTNVSSFFMIIVAPIFLLGRQGFPWAIGSILLAFSFQFAHWQGYVFPDLVPPADRAADAFVTWASSAVVVLFFAFFYEEARSLAELRLRDANRAKTQFLANISHELRTPLHALMASGAMLDEASLSPEQRSLVRRGQENAAALGELIDDLLDLSALETGRFTLRATDFEPAAVVEGVAAVTAGACEEKRLTFSYELAPDLPPLVRGDPRRLRQILLNLTGNAIKFTDSGRVRLAAAAAQSPAFPHACIFTVADTGVGIPEQHQRRIFSSFTQIDGTLARPHEGAGLGLYITRQLIQHMGGTIGLHSAPGRGSTFRVELPFTAAATAASEETAAAELASTTAPLEVLLVEDNAINRELGQRMLERLGHQVSVACSGEEGLRLLEETRPDVVLMDIQMPGMDGLATMRAIREHERGLEKLPLVAMSGNHSAQHRAAYEELGVLGVLERPFSREDLEATLRAVERSRPSADDAVSVTGG